jgi:hypothetical protein
MRKHMKKVIILLIALVILAPTVTAFRMFPLHCSQKIKYDPMYGGELPGAWVGTLRIPTSPSGTYDLVQWADPEPIWYGPLKALNKRAEEAGIIFGGSIEIFHEEWELMHPETGEILAKGYDRGYFDVEKGKWVVYGKVTEASGELDFLEDCWIKQSGVVTFRKDAFHGRARWKFFKVD